MDGWYIDDVEGISFKPVSTYTSENAPGNKTAYPNPTSDLVVLDTAPGTNVQIVDAQGRKVATLNTSGQKTISLQHLTNGLYHLVWINENGENKATSVTLMR